MSEARDTIESACAQALDVEVSIFESFSRIRVDEQIRFENATCGRRFLLISSLEKKKIPSRKYPYTCGGRMSEIEITLFRKQLETIFNKFNCKHFFF